MTITIPNISFTAQAKGGAVVFTGNLSDFPADILAQAAAYAIHKKVQDASGGSDMTGAEAREAAQAVITSLKAGTWAKRGGGPRATDEASFKAKEFLKIAQTWLKVAANAEKAKAAGKSVNQVAEAFAQQPKHQDAVEKLWQAKLAKAATQGDDSPF